MTAISARYTANKSGCCANWDFVCMNCGVSDAVSTADLHRLLRIALSTACKHFGLHQLCKTVYQLSCLPNQPAGFPPTVYYIWGP